MGLAANRHNGQLTSADPFGFNLNGARAGVAAKKLKKSDQRKSIHACQNSDVFCAKKTRLMAGPSRPLAPVLRH